MIFERLGEHVTPAKVKNFCPKIFISQMGAHDKTRWQVQFLGAI
jgi:hypothetical protein